MHWQNWSYKKIYAGIIFPIYGLLTLRYGILPFDLIHVNRGFSDWGLPFASKYDFLEPFKKTPQFLAHHVLDTNKSVDENIKSAKAFMKQNTLSYPIIAKPERGVIGIGIVKIKSDDELRDLLQKMPANYLLQEFADLPLEFGVYYRRFPWEKTGTIVSLTRKDIPHVTGNGKSTVAELVEKEPSFVWNKASLLKHARTLDHIPKKGERFQVILQASHTYGTVFTDWNANITKEMNAWVDKICQHNPDFHYGRFDIKFPNIESIHTGKGAKLIELNGTTAEPTHMYDDRNSLGFGIRAILASYKNAFRIAKYNKKKWKAKTPIRTIIRKYKAYLKTVKEIKRVIG